MSASEENRANMSWFSDENNKTYVFEDLVIGKDTDWVRSESGEEIQINPRFGFNPPCFTRKDEKGNVHIFSREYKLVLGREPLRMLEKKEHIGPLPKHCTREQWNINDDTGAGVDDLNPKK